jgi:hypothetical protein
LRCCLLGRFAAAVGTLLAPGGLALRPPELLRSAFEATRVLDGFSFGVGDEVSEAQVEPDGHPVMLLGSVAEVADDKDVPMPVGAMDEVGGLRCAFERTVLLDFETAPELLRDAKPVLFGVEEHVPSAPILPKLYRMPAVGPLEARKVRLLAELATAQETLEGSVETVGERLHCGLRDVLSATPLEAVGQIVAAEELARSLVMGLDHFEHLVVQMAAFGQTGKKPSVLGAVEEEPVLEGLVHLLVVPDTGTMGNGYSAARPKATALNPRFLQNFPAQNGSARQGPLGSVRRG